MGGIRATIGIDTQLESVTSALLPGLVSLVCAIALGCAALAWRRSSNIRVSRVWVWSVAVLTLALGGALSTTAGALVGRQPQAVATDLVLVTFGLVVMLGAFRTAIPGTLPVLPTALDVLPPALVVG